MYLVIFVLFAGRNVLICVTNGESKMEFNRTTLLLHWIEVHCVQKKKHQLIKVHKIVAKQFLNVAISHIPVFFWAPSGSDRPTCFTVWSVFSCFSRICLSFVCVAIFLFSPKCIA